MCNLKSIELRIEVPSVSKPPKICKKMIQVLKIDPDGRTHRRTLVVRLVFQVVGELDLITKVEIPRHGRASERGRGTGHQQAQIHPKRGKEDQRVLIFPIAQTLSCGRLVVLSGHRITGRFLCLGSTLFELALDHRVHNCLRSQETDHHLFAFRLYL